MKTTTVKKLSAFGLITLISVTVTFGQPILSIDENGHGSIGSSNAVPFNVGPDPTGGLPGNVLIYTLPFQVNSGDLVLIDTNTSPIADSDVLRFFTPVAGGPSEVIFYSDNDAADFNGALADTGLPIVGPNAFFAAEIGLEGGPNGLAWNPPVGAPGSLVSGAPMTYNIISDAPEPSTGVQLLAGFGVLLGVLGRRRLYSRIGLKS